MANRYALRMDHPDSWTVFDVFTGQPAECDHKIMVGINAGEADEAVRRLNDLDVRRREEADR
jgi:1,2-phenylacetyl-CoA epoxidase PaaB subunit